LYRWKKYKLHKKNEASHANLSELLENIEIHHFSLLSQ